MQRLNDETVGAVDVMCGGEFTGSPTLSYQPATMPSDQIDALVAFSYGFRFADADIRRGRDIPPMDALLPGPVNEELAARIAAFVHNRPVPIVAQWEIARVLVILGVPDVVSVEPDVGSDGSTVYLSTADVLDKGLRLADEAGIRLHHVGVIAHLDHAPRCVATARACDVNAALIVGVDLPRAYDSSSGQRWTRDRVTWIATDLFARTQLIASTDWTSSAKVTP